MLCVTFATLLIGVYYFLKQNTKFAQKDITRLQAQYIAEAGNARALSRINIKTLPEIDIEDEDDGFDDDFDDDDDFFEDDDDFDDDDFFEDDEDFDDEDDDFFDDDEVGVEALANIPRYVNFYHKNPFYVNIETGSVVSEAQFLALLSQQRSELATARAAGQDVNNTLLVEEVFLPLPEVNVHRIGSITIPKGAHLKEGFKIILAEKVPVDFKLPDIREEFLNIIPPELEFKEKPILRSLSPNTAEPGTQVDISLDGDFLEELPVNFSTGDITLVDVGSNLISITVSEKAKPGRYKVRIGPLSAEFYIVPPLGGFEPPEIERIDLSERAEDGSIQFTRIKDQETISGLTIRGFDLGSEENVPIIVPDARGITAEIVSISETRITFNLSVKNATLGQHYLTVYNKGGAADVWIFNVDEKSLNEEDKNPDIATYSTVMTLLEVESLSNIPIGEGPADLDNGRPQAAGGDDRPDDATEDAGLRAPRINRRFDLLRSDLSSVWKVETIASINGISYRETNIVRRKVPEVNAALTTNARVRFGTGDITVEGIQEASTTLQEASASGDTTIIVEGVDPDEQFFALDEDDQDRPPDITGQAVIEDLGLGFTPGSPASRGFKKDGLVAIVDQTASSDFTDFSFITEVGDNTITVEDPGFDRSHFVNDIVQQFIPSVITPFGIDERAAQKHLVPESSHVPLADKEGFEQVFSTRIEDLENWSGASTDNTTVPDDIFSDFEGYFGLNIIEGTPNYDGANSLIGQGVLIVDTTRGGLNPAGGTVKMGGSSRLPSEFDGVIYIIGALDITGAVELSGALVVSSPGGDDTTLNIGGQGFIKYNPISITKSIIDLPFARQLHSRLIVKSKETQDEFLKKQQGALKALSGRDAKRESDIEEEEDLLGDGFDDDF